MQKRVEPSGTVIIVSSLGYWDPCKNLGEKELANLKQLVGGFEFYFNTTVTSKATACLVIYHTKRGLPPLEPEVYEGERGSLHRLKSGRGRVRIAGWCNAIKVKGKPEQPGFLGLSFQPEPLG